MRVLSIKNAAVLAAVLVASLASAQTAPLTTASGHAEHLLADDHA